MTPEALFSTYIALTAIIWGRYFFVAGLFYYLLWARPEDAVRARRLAEKKPDRATVLHEIKMSLVSSAIYAVPGAIVLEAYKSGGTAIYTEIGGFWGWIYVLASIAFYLLLHDAYFYWTHRAMHHPKLSARCISPIIDHDNRRRGRRSRFTRGRPQYPRGFCRWRRFLFQSTWAPCFSC